ncbi:hypothetical protein CC1G_09986 [Coprinopsis cinerea okayama7|uniref:Secreted protein n=1 Tax=Coprinopsis cinerea (strain Okayama-7 / 130 / ATCC MYA-4618 / FGSC 9003) TaxID=240176 RepID=A8NDH4_COPC7|nr:hypothetical protein CC1G_09986 [Coprinopsis cinerea okayama7\|eukprot:XP_001832772.1 hypothetical protein CC1G_09986 [Coprinopsis cinerea okayama7\
MFSRFFSSVHLALLAVVLSIVGRVVGLPQPAEGPPQGPTAEELIHAAETGELVIVPGEGLPSLESLGLTSRDIVVRTLERLEALKQAEEANRDANSSSLTRRYTPTCSWSTSMSIDYAWFCYDYLHSIGGTTCFVPSGGSRFCHTTAGSNNVAWWGSVNGVASTQSSCANVANGGVWVLNNCRTYSWDYTWYMLSEGTNAAWGNENLIVTVGNM